MVRICFIVIIRRNRFIQKIVPQEQTNQKKKKDASGS